MKGEPQRWALEGGLGLGRKEGFAVGQRLGEVTCGVLGWRGRSLGSIIILGTGMRAAPGSCRDQARHTGLDLPAESTSRLLGTVGSV